MKRYLLVRLSQGGLNPALEIFGKFQSIQVAVAELNRRQNENKNLDFFLVEVLD